MQTTKVPPGYWMQFISDPPKNKIREIVFKRHRKILTLHMTLLSPDSNWMQPEDCCNNLQVESNYELLFKVEI